VCRPTGFPRVPTTHTSRTRRILGFLAQRWGGRVLSAPWGVKLVPDPNAIYPPTLPRGTKSPDMEARVLGRESTQPLNHSIYLHITPVHPRGYLFHPPCLASCINQSVSRAQAPRQVDTPLSVSPVDLFRLGWVRFGSVRFPINRCVRDQGSQPECTVRPFMDPSLPSLIE
jgi:hypothetical protein